jgi:hypothetical protein
VTRANANSHIDRNNKMKTPKIQPHDLLLSHAHNKRKQAAAAMQLPVDMVRLFYLSYARAHMSSPTDTSRSLQFLSFARALSP